VIFEKGLKKTLDTYEKWWAGELDRPLIPITLTGHMTERKAPRRLYGGQSSFGNPDITPEELIDGADFELSSMEFLGDAFPIFNGIYSGPGIVAAFLGTDIKVDNGNIWFYPKDELPLEQLHFTYHGDNFWLKRMKAVMSEAKSRWGDSVVIGMPDLGGVADILATFRGTQNLMLDLYDTPDEVVRVMNEIKLLWHRYYDELLPFTTPGFHTDWSGILSSKRSYMLQCDFCYMLGTDMFDRFIADELDETCSFLERGCYHLDGIGQVPFLPRLLKIKGLNLIQWVPGDGPYADQDWFELYRTVLESGRHLQILYDPNHTSLNKLIDYFGTGKNIVEYGRVMPAHERGKALKLLAN